MEQYHYFLVAYQTQVGMGSLIHLQSSRNFNAESMNQVRACVKRDLGAMNRHSSVVILSVSHLGYMTKDEFGEF